MLSPSLRMKKKNESTPPTPPEVKQWLQMTGALFIAYDALHTKI